MAPRFKYELLHDSIVTMNQQYKDNDYNRYIQLTMCQILKSRAPEQRYGYLFTWQ